MDERENIILSIYNSNYLNVKEEEADSRALDTRASSSTAKELGFLFLVKP